MRPADHWCQGRPPRPSCRRRCARESPERACVPRWLPRSVVRGTKARGSCAAPCAGRSAHSPGHLHSRAMRSFGSVRGVAAGAQSWPPLVGCARMRPAKHSEYRNMSQTRPLDSRLTEQRNPRSTQIDQLSTIEIVDLINAEDRMVAQAVGEEREQIAKCIDFVVDTFKRGGRLFYVGAGTSGRLGVLDSAEMPPTYGTDPEMVQGIIAAGYAALVRAQDGAG